MKCCFILMMMIPLADAFCLKRANHVPMTTALDVSKSDDKTTMAAPSSNYYNNNNHNQNVKYAKRRRRRKYNGMSRNSHESRQRNHEIVHCTSAMEVLKVLQFSLTHIGGGGQLTHVNLSTSLHRIYKHTLKQRKLRAQVFQDAICLVIGGRGRSRPPG